MRRRPPTGLPEESSKQDTQPVKPQRRRRFGCLLWLALVLLSIGFVSTVGLLLYRPDVVGLAAEEDLSGTGIVFDSTADSLRSTAQALGSMSESLQQTRIALEITAQYNVSRDFDFDSTRVALDNRQFAVQQTGTQAVRDLQATETTVAIVNAQQGTQAVLDFRNTQTAFDRAATQAELSYQGTQAALNQEATAAVLGFATEAPPAEDVLTQTPPPTLTQQPLFTDGFGGGLNETRWSFSAVEDWSLQGEAGRLVAQRNAAWLLSQRNDLSGYVLETTLLPVTGVGVAADYHLLLNVHGTEQTPNGYAIRLRYDGTRVTTVGLYLFSLDDLFTGEGLLNRPLSALQSTQLELAPAQQINVRAEVRDNQIVAVVNERLALNILLDNVPIPGAVGVQIPTGAAIDRIVVRP